MFENSLTRTATTSALPKGNYNLLYSLNRTPPLRQVCTLSPTKPQTRMTTTIPVTPGRSQPSVLLSLLLRLLLIPLTVAIFWPGTLLCFGHSPLIDDLRNFFFRLLSSLLFFFWLFFPPWRGPFFREIRTKNCLFLTCFSSFFFLLVWVKMVGMSSAATESIKPQSYEKSWLRELNVNERKQKKHRKIVE